VTPRRRLRLDLAILGGMRTHKLSPLSRAAVSSGMTPRRKLTLDLAIPGGAANCKAVATFEGCWGIQRSDAAPQIQIEPRRPWGAANCETVATFKGCWEIHQNDAPPQTQIRARQPGGLRTTKRLPLSKSAGGSTEVTPRHRLRLGFAIPGGWELRSCRHFSGLLGGPAE